MGNYRVINAPIIKKEELAETIYDMTVESDYLARTAQCGQFLHIDCGDEFVLRRPISICEITKQGIRFIFDVRGKGTKRLSEKQVGDTVDILGPLGNGFTIRQGNALVIGGGIGIYPLYELTKHLACCDVALGFRTKALVMLEEEFRNQCDHLYVATDDGSYGICGTALQERLEQGAYNAVYACGPLPMLKAVKQITDRYDIFCQLSMEERMGCGIGACLCCNVKTEDDGAAGFRYLHVCKDGPVFHAREVIL